MVGPSGLPTLRRTGPDPNAERWCHMLEDGCLAEVADHLIHEGFASDETDALIAAMNVLMAAEEMRRTGRSQPWRGSGERQLDDEQRETP